MEPAPAPYPAVPFATRYTPTFLPCRQLDLSWATCYTAAVVLPSFSFALQSQWSILEQGGILCRPKMLSWIC